MADWRITVDGRVLPKPVAGHPALELCNTRSHWGGPDELAHEYLLDHAHLTTLATVSGLLPPDRAATLVRTAARHSGEADSELERALSLRGDLYAVLTGSGSRTQFRRVADAARDARRRQELVRDGRGARWDLPGRPRLDEPLDRFLLAASQLLTSGDAATVRACPGSGCGWLFLDPSGRRRWCQMAVCGNRAKQAAHAARARA